MAARARRAKHAKATCEDCFFRRNMLCALDLSEPCATFRPDRPEGLVPPRQLTLVERQALPEVVLAAQPVALAG